MEEVRPIGLEMVMRRGDVWLVKLDPTLGSEIKKTRHCDLCRNNLELPMATSSRRAVPADGGKSSRPAKAVTARISSSVPTLK